MSIKSQHYISSLFRASNNSCSFTLGGILGGSTSPGFTYRSLGFRKSLMPTFPGWILMCRRAADRDVNFRWQCSHIVSRTTGLWYLDQ